MQLRFSAAIAQNLTSRLLLKTIVQDLYPTQPLKVKPA